MFFEGHAWEKGAVFIAKSGTNQEKGFFKKNTIEKRINDFLIFSKTKRFLKRPKKKIGKRKSR